MERGLLQKSYSGTKRESEIIPTVLQHWVQRQILLFHIWTVVVEVDRCFLAALYLSFTYYTSWHLWTVSKCSTHIEDTNTWFGDSSQLSTLECFLILLLMPCKAKNPTSFNLFCIVCPQNWINTFSITACTILETSANIVTDVSVLFSNFEEIGLMTCLHFPASCLDSQFLWQRTSLRFCKCSDHQIQLLALLNVTKVRFYTWGPLVSSTFFYKRLQFIAFTAKLCLDFVTLKFLLALISSGWDQTHTNVF